MARTRAGLVVLGAALAAGSGASAVAASLPPAPARGLSFLHVGPVSGPAGLRQIVDANGRVTLLKGVNVDGLVDYWRKDLGLSYPTGPAAYAGGACPPDDPSVEGVRLCDFDFAQMRPLGFDAIRLNLSWSLLEPNPGQIDQAYLARIAQVVDWAKAQGIYIVLDIHQDAWSKYVYTPPGQSCPPPLQSTRGYDGAPAWASVHVSPVCALNGTRELDAAVGEAFQRLYSDVAAPDGVGLQEHYAATLTALARRFAGEPAVAGYEVINEPSPGFNAVPGAMDATELFPFYGKVVNAVLQAVPRFRQLFFLEPNAERNLTDQPQALVPWSTFSAYPNVVYAPHVYTGVFTLDQELTGQRFFPPDGGYRSSIADAKTLDTPLWVGEFGNNPSDDQTLLRTSYSLQDQYGLAGTLWLWKENANDVNPSFFWGVYGPPFGAGTPQPRRQKFVDRAFALSTAGTLQSQHYDPDASSFELRATSQRVGTGDRGAATVVFLPQNVNGAVTAENADLELFDRFGAREAYVYPRGGPYRLLATAAGAPPTTTTTTPVAADLRACVSNRSLTLRLAHARDVRVRGVSVRLDGRRVSARVMREARRVEVRLRGLRGAVASVTIVLRVRTAPHGRARMVTLHRTYHPCKPGGARHARR
jgi:endoglycosylceramidase